MVDIRESPSGPLINTGGGGGGVEPLSLTFFVDPASNAELPDGSIGAPFVTIQAGIDRLAEEATPGTLLLAAGDYGGEETETDLAEIGFVGLGLLSNIGPLTFTDDGVLSMDAWVRQSGITVSGGTFTVDQTLPSNVLYVDLSTTVPESKQDGSPQRPFSTLGAANAVANTIGPCAILLPPGTYNDSVYTFNDPVSLVGVGATLAEEDSGLFNGYLVSNVRIESDIGFASNAAISNIFVFSEITCNTNLTLDACQIFRTVGGNIFGRGISPINDITGTPRNPSRIRNIVDANIVQLDSYMINGVGCASLRLTNCWYTNITTASRLELINSFGFGIPTIVTTGDVLLDPSSYGSIRVDASAVTIDPSSLIVRQNLGWQLTVTVPVPEIPAGTVEYVEVASPIASLTLTPDDCVTACPKEDITPPSANAGVYLGVRCTDAGALRFCFMGPVGEVEARDIDFTVAILS